MRHGGGGGQPLMPPPPSPTPGFKRCWCWGHGANGTEVVLCMLPFHQTIHVLSARLARRGATQMSFVAK